ncbi:MAG: hypothetical protein ACPGJS_02040 [Flammeovirgaceae bacterium]
MKEIRVDAQTPKTSIEFNLLERSQVELFVHNVGRSRSIRVAKVTMHKGLQQINIQTDKLQKGIYVYVLKANQQQMDFGRLVIH